MKTMHYHSRILEAKLKEYLSFFSVLGLTGPRQSGKSTLLQHVLPDYTYVSFDDMRLVDFYRSDPVKFMRTYNNKVIFDEVHKVPELFNEIKLAVDQDRNNPGKFVLTSSSQFSFHQKISESLAGRIGLLTLLPYQMSELPIATKAEAIFCGSYPEVVEKHYQFVYPWYEAYFETYINNDVRALSNIGDMTDFRRFIRLLAANTSQLLNISNYARDLGVEHKTIKRWLSILQASYIIFIIPPYFKNLGKRIVKSPKVYFYDTGLVAYLTGIETQAQYEKGPMAGSLFENYVIAEILKNELHHKRNSELFFYRVHQGLEVDLIIDRKQSLEWIEIKKSETFHPRMVAPMEKLMGLDDKGYLLYNGQNFPYPPPIKILNYCDYLTASSARY